jgi:Flp pilus assembly pilin Flp
MLFGGLVIVVYNALAYARRFSAGCDGACTAQGLEYGFLVCVEVLVAVLIVSLAMTFVGWLPSPRGKGQVSRSRRLLTGASS